MPKNLRNNLLKPIVHIHVPKTGGTWLNETLSAYAPYHFIGFDNTHLPLDAAFNAKSEIIPIQQVVDGYKNVSLTYTNDGSKPDNPGRFETAWKLGIVRNPFDLLVSYYLHDVAPSSHFRSLRSFYDEETGCDLPCGWSMVNIIHNIRCFDEFIKLFCDLEFAWIHTRFRDFLFYQLFYGNRRCGADIIFRQEKLHEATRSFLEFGKYIPPGYGIQRSTSNVSSLKKKDYRSYYTDELRELVEEKCKKELSMFSYDFDGPLDDEAFITEIKKYNG